MTHTSGPWSVWNDEIVAQDDTSIAMVGLHDGLNPTEWQSNLCLIAAAPEMFVALKRILEGFDRGAFVRTVVNDDKSDWAIQCVPYLRALALAQQAITKAEGEVLA